MSKQIINIGTVANDGTGDPARTAFDKSNQNFDELYDFMDTLNRFKGLYASSAALIAANPAGNPGDWGQVDIGAGFDVQVWYWDEDDTQWVQQESGGVSPPASDIVAGIMKLYGTPGANTDGTMTQAAIVAAIAAGVARTYSVTFSDETTPITASAGKISFKMPYAVAAISEIIVELRTAQSSGAIFTIDINKNGASIFSTRPTIDNTETGSNTATTPAVLSSASIAKYDIITVDVDQVGNGTAIGGKIHILG